MKSRPHLLRRFVGDVTATAAIQMAILLPVMIAGFLSMTDMWSLLSTNIDMRAGVNAAANLAMQGEADTTMLQAAALDGWSNPPSDAAVAVDRSCSCSGMAVACTTLCSGQKAPQILVTIKATGTWNAPFSVSALPIQEVVANQQVIRVR
jgi:Flp pilus assembly protein TadG